MNPMITAVVSIALSVAAQFSLKAGMSGVEIKAVLSEPFSLRTLISIFTDKYILLGFLLYGLGAIFWLGVLSKWEVSKAYPSVGLGFAFTVAVGFLVGEGVTLIRVAGVALICAGVLLIGRS